MNEPFQPLDQNWPLPDIDPELRERLKAEMARWGRVLIPLIVDEYERIIDGKIRWEIAQELGFRDIPRIIIKGLTDEEKHDLRLVINLCRRHLTREQVRQWIAWELQLHPDHSDRMVAGRIGASPTTVGKVRATVQVGQSQPRLGADGKYRKPVIHTSLDRQRKQAQEILQKLDDVPSGNLNLRKLRTLQRVQDRAQKIASANPVQLKDFVVFPCDFRHVGERIKSGSVDLAICDPPWNEYESLGRPLGDTLCRILKPNGIACVYTGAFFDDEWNDRLRSAGLKKEWMVITLHKRPGSLIRLGPLAGVIMHGYTSILVYRNKPTGVLPVAKTLVDVIDSPNLEKDLHVWQQPVEESVKLIECLSRPNDLICDLTIGSGTVGVATARVGEGRRFAGCEIDAALVRAAQARIAEELSKSTT